MRGAAADLDDVGGRFPVLAQAAGQALKFAGGTPSGRLEASPSMGACSAPGCPSDAGWTQAPAPQVPTLHQALASCTQARACGNPQSTMPHHLPLPLSRATQPEGVLQHQYACQMPDWRRRQRLSMLQQSLAPYANCSCMQVDCSDWNLLLEWSIRFA